ncbi:MAG: hypothetical protein PHG66_06605 [Candidatus Colwellbacteria bacterium]|nr:hypothetical protein [Candidatus Colwellbacteria bacterium]
MENKNGFILRWITEISAYLKSKLSGRWLIPASVLSISVILVLVCFLTWDKLLSPEARQGREDAKNVEEFFNEIDMGEKAQRDDTYGGKTPEETMQLFIAALEKEDLELAAKYFLLAEPGVPDPKWIEQLKKAKDEKRLNDSINLLREAKFTGESMPGYAGFDILGSDGSVIYGIDLVKNTYSSLWKISNM